MTSVNLIKDKHIPWLFVAFFVFVAVVDSIMVTLAITTHSGVVSDHPYERGLHYNKVVAAANAQMALGWQGKAEYVNGELRIAVHDREGNLLPLDTASAYFTRPSKEGSDFSIKMNGYSKKVAFPADGVWDVRMEMTSGAESFQFKTRLVIP